MKKILETGGTFCGLRKILNIIGGKWKILILCTIYTEKNIRYNEFKRKVSEITNTMLAQSLHELENDNLIFRKQFNEMPVRVEYELTEKCKTMIPILLELNDWSEKNILN